MASNQNTTMDNNLKLIQKQHGHLTELMKITEELQKLNDPAGRYLLEMKEGRFHVKTPRDLETENCKLREQLHREESVSKTTKFREVNTKLRQLLGGQTTSKDTLKTQTSAQATEIQSM